MARRRNRGLGIPRWAFRALNKEDKTAVVMSKLDRVTEELAQQAAEKKAASDVAVAEASGQSGLMKAIPWLIGAVAIGGMIMLRRWRK